MWMSRAELVAECTCAWILFGVNSTEEGPHIAEATSPAFVQLLGYIDADVLGRDSGTLNPTSPADAEDWRNLLALAAAG